MSSAKPTFTVTYVSFKTAGKPFNKDTTADPVSKDLPKPPSNDEILKFGAYWTFRASGTGVNEVINLERG